MPIKSGLAVERKTHRIRACALSGHLFPLRNFEVSYEAQHRTPKFNHSGVVWGKLLLNTEESRMKHFDQVGGYLFHRTLHSIRCQGRVTDSGLDELFKLRRRAGAHRLNAGMRVAVWTH